MEDNALNPEPRPNEPNNEHEVDEEGNILNISIVNHGVPPDASDPG